MKNKFTAYNIIISVALALILMCGLFFTFGYNLPTKLKQQTGVVSKFKQYDKKWYDYILNDSKSSYLKVYFKDNSYFEATGICYDCIDRSLFKNLQIGEEITITYFEKSGLKKICSIVYNGKTYLSLENVLNEYNKNEKVAHIVAPTIMILSILIGIVLFIINYKKNRGK